jgi:hypothetical protein
MGHRRRASFCPADQDVQTHLPGGLAPDGELHEANPDRDPSARKLIPSEKQRVAPIFPLLHVTITGHTTSRL